MKRLFVILALGGVSSLALAQTTTVQTAPAPAAGTATGAVTGAVGGAVVGGPVGAVVGGVAGAIVGGIADSMQPKFNTYVVEQKPARYVWRDGRVAVGATLPSSGVTYYSVPAEYSVNPGYRYAYVNDNYVLVDPSTHRIVQVIR